MKVDLKFWRDVEKIAVEAGQIILKVRSKGVSVSEKPDQSPVTEADYASNKYILTKLSELCTIPVLSEERLIELDLGSGYCFVVDPLDGTKSFISGRDDFCVNIGLLKAGEPYAGVIYIPVTGDLFSCFDNEVYLNSEPIEFEARLAPFKGAKSYNHSSGGEQYFLNFNNVDSFISRGAALKFTAMLTGEVDIYVRFAPCSEWDTAAGHALLKSYGGDIIDLNTMQTLKYGKTSYLNGPFVAFIDGINVKYPDDLKKLISSVESY